MKKYSKSIIVSVLALSSLGLISSTYARPFGNGSGQCMRGAYKGGPGQKQGFRGFNIDRMAARLNLTDDQRTQIEVIVDNSKPEMTELRNAMQENRQQLRELAQQSALNETEVRKIADTQGDLKAEMIVLHANQRANIRAILTDDQRVQMNEVRGKRRWRR